MKMTDAESRPNGRTTLHNVRFYNLIPCSIQVLAHNKLTHKLALAREDGSIEIWDVQYAPLLEKTIPRVPGASLEALVWAGDRLFSAGLSGELIEWNLQTLQPLRQQYVTGNAIWCLAVNPQCTELAIGTEQGYINIFDIERGKMMYKHLFDKQEGRVLCCKFDTTGEFLVTGSVGVVRIWSVKSGHALHKMTVAKAEKHQAVIVWSLQVLSDFSIISGDSRGCVTVWDGHTASQIESHQVLKADVLTIAVNEEESMLVCSGIEPVIRIYAKTLIRKEDNEYYRWVKFLQRSVHDHDVNAVLCVGDRILSGGMDGYLGITSMSKVQSRIAKYGPFLQKPCAAVAPAQNLLLLRYKRYLEVWRLGTTSGKVDFNTQPDDKAATTTPLEPLPLPLPQEEKSLVTPLEVDTGPEKLLELKSNGEEPIICATISPDGQWIAYSTEVKVRIFRYAAGKTPLTRIKHLPQQFTAASHILFSSDSKRLFLITALKQQVQVFAVVANGSCDFDFVECIETANHVKDTIHLFTVSPCGMYLAVAGVDRTIAVWSVHRGKHFKHHLNLPRYAASPSAIAIHAHQPRLVAAFTDGKIFEYDFEEMCFTCTDRHVYLPSAEHHCISNVLLDARNPSIFVMQNDANYFVLEKCLADSDDQIKDDGQYKSLKKSKRLISDSKVCSLRLKSEKKFEHLQHMDWLNSDTLVAVSVNPTSLIVQLPDAFKQKKFGVM